MAVELVRVRVGSVEKNMGRVLAESSDGVTVLDEPIRTPAGRLRGETRRNGRPKKPKTTVANEASAKAAASVASSNNKES